jgi:hypothetical protein
VRNNYVVIFGLGVHQEGGDCGGTAFVPSDWFSI